LKHTLFIDASAMSTICFIDEEDLTEAGQDSTQQQTPPCPETPSHFEMKDSIMNSKFLYVATLAVSLLSTLAMADEGPVSRTQVKAELSKAIANGTLQRTDYDADRRDAADRSTQTRDQVVAELAAAKASRKSLKGPDANRTYNPSGTEIYRPSIVTRAEVKADVLQAAANGTLQRTDYDDAALAARRVKAHIASVNLAQRVKAALAHSVS